MKTAITIIATATALMPAAALAQSHEHAAPTRTIVRMHADDGDARSAKQARARARAEARAEQRRRDQRDQEEQTERVTQTLKIGANGELELSNLSGDIIITRGSGNGVQVEAVKIAHARTADEAREALKLVRVEFLERGSGAEVRVSYPRGNQRSRNIDVSVQYNVTAPESTRISANSLSGNIRATDIKGDLSLETLSGDVIVENATRVMLAKSTSGNVTINNLRSEIGLEAGTVSGNLMIRNSSARRMEFNSVSGNMTLTDLRSERIEAQSISGNIELATAFEKNGRYELNSHSGVIRVAPRGDVGFELEANSFSGNIQTGLELQNVSQNAPGAGWRRAGGTRSLTGTYGDGSATLEITTFSGTVLLGKK